MIARYYPTSRNSFDRLSLLVIEDLKGTNPNKKFDQLILILKGVLRSLKTLNEETSFILTRYR